MRPWLAVKLAGCLVASGVAIFALFGYWNLKLHRQGAEEMVLQSADRISDVIQRATRYQMLRNDRQALYQAIRDIGSEPGIPRVRIFNKLGSIRFSTDPSEVNRSVDKQAEACYGCHAQAQPLTRLHRPDRARIFADPHGRRVLALIRPIGNETACWSADCHAHDRGQRVLGVIDTHLSLETVDSQLGLHQAQLTRFMGATLAALCLVSVVFVWVVVHRPVKQLMQGTRRVAAGDLDHRLPSGSRDELGDLAASFNQMTADLAAARAEITERTQAALLHSQKLASLGKLAATVAHEVNNPLFGILTYSRLSLKELEKPDADKARVAETLRIIERESRRCGDLMRNLLSFSRQAPHRRQLNCLRELVERSLALVRHELELTNIELETHFAPDTARVECDAAQIQQAILVLLVNAVEAMPKGGHIAGLDLRHVVLRVALAVTHAHFRRLPRDRFVRE
ncbi:MAG: HAMP domain-containing protein, partial [Acidobacteria bacterium]|nr:HAMP domain-containing protein [Acidobacteriota bacterium]